MRTKEERKLTSQIEKWLKTKHEKTLKELIAVKKRYVTITSDIFFDFDADPEDDLEYQNYLIEDEIFARGYHDVITDLAKTSEYEESDIKFTVDLLYKLSIIKK